MQEGIFHGIVEPFGVLHLTFVTGVHASLLGSESQSVDSQLSSRMFICPFHLVIEELLYKILHSSS